MEKKKTFQSMLRMDEDWADRFKKVAARYSLDPATLNRVVMEKFIETFEEQGDQMIWPPQFNYHTNRRTYLNQIHQADGEILDMVADGPPPPGQRYPDLAAALDEKIGQKTDAPADSDSAAS